MNSVNINIPNLKEGQILQIEMVEGKILISMRNNKPPTRQNYSTKPFRRNWKPNYRKPINTTFRVNVPNEVPRTEIRKHYKDESGDDESKSLDEIIKREEKKPYYKRKYLK